MPRSKKVPAPQAATSKSSAADKRVEMKNDVKDTFPSKTFDVIEHCNQHDPAVASWDAEGTAFIIKDVTSLSQFYLPKKFDHSNFQSFVRQLNLYGFRNVSKETEGFSGDSGAGPGHVVFKNDNFKRGRRDLLVNIRRSKKGDRSQRKTRQEEELHSICEALNQRFDRVDVEVKSLHAKMDLLSSRLDKVLNLLLADRSQGGSRGGDSGGDNGENRDVHRYGGDYSRGKRRRFQDGDNGRGEDDGGAHSVSASEASKDGATGYHLAATSFAATERENSAGEVSIDGSLPRNINPACSEPFPLPPGKSRSSSAEKHRNCSDGSGIDVVLNEGEAVKFDRDLVAACETILENNSFEDKDVSPVRGRVAIHAPRGNGGEEAAGQEHDISALDVMPLNLDGFDDIAGDGGSSSLSGEDDILMTYNGEHLEQPPGVAPNLRVATVYDQAGNAAGGRSDISFRRGSGRKYFSHRSIMAGITLMSVIAAIAVGTVFSVGRRSQDVSPDSPETSVDVSVFEEAPPCYNCAEITPSGGTVETETATDDAQVGLKESALPDASPLRVSPTPSPSLLPSSRRRTMGHWNDISPATQPPTMRTIRF